jgi:hypothetical protein
MTAPIVGEWPDLRSGDFAVKRHHSTPGQLWERLAEATPNVLSNAYSLRLMDAALNAYIRAGSRRLAARGF